MNKGFYNCERCGWSGSELYYVGNRHPTLPPGQGVCPKCHTVFQGCVHPDMIEQWRAARVGAILERTGW